MKKQAFSLNESTLNRRHFLNFLYRSAQFSLLFSAGVLIGCRPRLPRPPRPPLPVRHSAQWLKENDRTSLRSNTKMKPGDELVLEDGTIATITAVHQHSIEVSVRGLKHKFHYHVG